MSIDALSLDEVVEGLARLGRDPGAVAEGEGPRAAVAAILRSTPSGGPELFFIQRAEHPNDPWSGHIAFPGGRHEQDDASLLATALRETREEVGVDLSRAELVARLPEIPAFVRPTPRGLLVTSFVFALREEVVLTPNYEVGATLWVPLASFARGEGKGTHRFSWEGQQFEVPCFHLGPERKILWGLTYRMLTTMLETLGDARGA